MRSCTLVVARIVIALPTTGLPVCKKAQSRPTYPLSCSTGQRHLSLWRSRPSLGSCPSRGWARRESTSIALPKTRISSTSGFYPDWSVLCWVERPHQVERYAGYACSPIPHAAADLQIVHRFQVSRSIDQANSHIKSSVEFMWHEIELKYNMLQYLVWPIPTVSFSGALVVVALAVSAGGDMLDLDGSSEIQAWPATMTTKVGIAFNTTHGGRSRDRSFALGG